MSLYSLLGRAARGDLDAQRALAREGAKMAFDGDQQPLICLTQSLIFARMAAEHGNAGDHGAVMAILGLLAENYRGLDATPQAEECEGEQLEPNPITLVHIRRQRSSWRIPLV